MDSPRKVSSHASGEAAAIATSLGWALPLATSSRAHRSASTTSACGWEHETTSGTGRETSSVVTTAPAFQPGGGSQCRHRTDTAAAKASTSGLHTDDTR